MRNYVLAIYRTEEFLRQHRPDGLSEDVRHAVASRYSRHIEFFMEHDPGFFQTIVQWMNRLGLQAPPHMGRGAHQVAKILGYERTVRFRAAFRRAKREARRFKWTRISYRQSTGRVPASQPA